MRNMDKALNRLLRSAAQAPVEFAPSAPFGLDDRVLAAGRRGRVTELAVLIKVIRHGLIWASVLMILALALSHYAPAGALANDTDLTASDWTIIGHE